MGKKIEISAEGRKCMFPNYKRILSVYNHGAYCHIHLEQIANEQTSKSPYKHKVVF